MNAYIERNLKIGFEKYCVLGCQLYFGILSAEIQISEGRVE